MRLSRVKLLFPEPKTDESSSILIVFSRFLSNFRFRGALEHLQSISWKDDEIRSKNGQNGVKIEMGKKLGEYARRGKTGSETARRGPLVARRAYWDSNNEIAQSLMRGARITWS